jgi:hypothetical protein
MRNKADLEKYSVIGSRFKLQKKNGVKYIIKEVNLTSLPQDKLKDIQKQILDYFSSLKKAGVPVPKFKNSYQENGRLYLVFRYVGKNLVQVFRSSPKDLMNKHKKAMEKILIILKKVQKRGLFLDPHIKNFVAKNGRIYFVDFSPPYTKKYNKMVLKSAKVSQKYIVKRNLDAFAPSNLGYHFAADLLREKKEIYPHMKELYNLLLKHCLIIGRYDKFTKKVNDIKKIEKDRIKRKIFLI